MALCSMDARGMAYTAGGEWRQLGSSADWAALVGGLGAQGKAVALSLSDRASGYHCPMNKLMIDDSWFCSRKQHWPRVAATAAAGSVGVNAKVPAPPAWLTTALTKVGVSVEPLADWSRDKSFAPQWQQHRLDVEREDERALAALRWQWRPKACRLAFFPPAASHACMVARHVLASRAHTAATRIRTQGTCPAWTSVCRVHTAASVHGA